MDLNWIPGVIHTSGFSVRVDWRTATKILQERDQKRERGCWVKKSLESH